MLQLFKKYRNMLFQIQIVRCYYTLKYNCLFTQVHDTH